jgi:hypothetical protein
MKQHANKLLAAWNTDKGQYASKLQDNAHAAQIPYTSAQRVEVINKHQPQAQQLLRILLDGWKALSKEDRYGVFADKVTFLYLFDESIWLRFCHGAAGCWSSGLREICEASDGPGHRPD